MESKAILQKLIHTWILLVLFFRFVASDTEKDKEECANELTGLAKCLPYVSGEANAPPTATGDCCTGFGQVIHKNLRCICLLVKDRNDTSLGLKINATLALSLPALCQVPANISDCTRLLHLPAGSPDAKLFDDFANNGTDVMSARARPRIGSTSSNNGGGCLLRPWLSLMMVVTVTVMVMVHLEYIS